MKIFTLAIAAVHGLLGVGALALIQAIVQAFAPAWHLPFSIWWGMVLCLPAIGMAIFVARAERRFNRPF